MPPKSHLRVAVRLQLSLHVTLVSMKCRFFKIPVRPEGTEGWAEEHLKALVTRDCLVGVSPPLTPAQLKALDAGPERKKAKS